MKEIKRLKKMTYTFGRGIGKTNYKIGVYKRLFELELELRKWGVK